MTDSISKYYAHGKLLLTGEYLVLQGAKALALPLKLGQSMTVAPGNSKNKITWEATVRSFPWFSCEFQLPEFKIIQSNDSEKAGILIKIFKTIQHLNPEFPLKKGFNIHTNLEFDPNWGLGSSSTLIANMASWTNADSYRLNVLNFKGSGYDIACANAGGPIFYRKGEKPVSVTPKFPFEDNLYFVYSGSKKNTRHGIKNFQNTKIDASKYTAINETSKNIVQAKTLDEFQKIIWEHEKIISGIIKEQPVQDKYFGDFKGVVKSLGAWGGDFYLAASSKNKKEMTNYFSKKGLKTIFSWDELVLNNRDQ